MNAIEIRYKRIMPALFCVLLAGVVCAISIYIFTTDKYKNQIFLKILTIGSGAAILYTVFKMAKKLRDNKPVLVITDRFIEITEKNEPVMINWADIFNYSIETDEGSQKLVLQTKAGKKEISINWLEKPAKEIEQLIEERWNRAKGLHRSDTGNR